MAPLIRRLVELYNADPARVARICDEQLDRSGNLLGYLRDEAWQRPNPVGNQIG